MGRCRALGSTLEGKDFSGSLNREPRTGNGRVMSVKRQYTRELRDNLHYLPTWLPTVRLSPGDLGRISDYEYTHIGNLRDVGLPSEIEDCGARADFEYFSQGSVSTTVKLAGQVPPVGSGLAEGDAGIVVDFGRENAVVFRASGCRSKRLKNVIGLGKQILEKLQQGQWPEDAVVVTEIVYATSATILICSGHKGHIDLRAAANMNPATLNIANLDAGLQVARESNIGVKIVAQSSLTPLMRTSGIQKRFLSDPVFRSKTQPAGEAVTIMSESGEELWFGDVEYEDYACA